MTRSSPISAPGEKKLTRAQLEEKIAALQEKKDGHEELFAQLEDGDERQLSHDR